jgi:hypothetical protein
MLPRSGRTSSGNICTGTVWEDRNYSCFYQTLIAGNGRESTVCAVKGKKYRARGCLSTARSLSPVAPLLRVPASGCAMPATHCGSLSLCPLLIVFAWRLSVAAMQNLVTAMRSTLAEQAGRTGTAMRAVQSRNVWPATEAPELLPLRAEKHGEFLV